MLQKIARLNNFLGLAEVSKLICPSFFLHFLSFFSLDNQALFTIFYR